MELIKVIAVYINDTKKDGTPYVNGKTGIPFKMATLKYEGGQATMILGGKDAQKDEETLRSWKSGENKKVTFVQNGEWVNFKLPSQLDILEERVTALEEKNASK